MVNIILISIYISLRAILHILLLLLLLQLSQPQVPARCPWLGGFSSRNSASLPFPFCMRVNPPPGGIPNPLRQYPAPCGQPSRVISRKFRVIRVDFLLRAPHFPPTNERRISTSGNTKPRSDQRSLVQITFPKTGWPQSAFAS